MNNKKELLKKELKTPLYKIVLILGLSFAGITLARQVYKEFVATFNHYMAVYNDYLENIDEIDT